MDILASAAAAADEEGGFSSAQDTTTIAAAANSQQIANYFPDFTITLDSHRFESNGVAVHSGEICRGNHALKCEILYRKTPPGECEMKLLNLNHPHLRSTYEPILKDEFHTAVEKVEPKKFRNFIEDARKNRNRLFSLLIPIIHRISTAICWVHMAHKDIFIGNICIDNVGLNNNGVPKLFDYGCAGSKVHTALKNISNCSSSSVDAEPPSQSKDVFDFAEMISQMVSFDSPSTFYSPPQLRELLSKMLTSNPLERPNMMEVTKWLESISSGIFREELFFIFSNAEEDIKGSFVNAYSFWVSLGRFEVNWLEFRGHLLNYVTKTTYPNVDHSICFTESACNLIKMLMGVQFDEDTVSVEMFLARCLRPFGDFTIPFKIYAENVRNVLNNAYGLSPSIGSSLKFADDLLTNQVAGSFVIGYGPELPYTKSAAEFKDSPPVFVISFNRECGTLQMSNMTVQRIPIYVDIDEDNNNKRRFFVHSIDEIEIPRFFDTLAGIVKMLSNPPFCLLQKPVV